MIKFLFCLLAVSLSGVLGDDDVEVLGSGNFDSFLASNEFVLVEFYAPWCGHCKRLEPEYAQAATTLKENGSTVRLGKVDVTQEEELGERFQIQGFPTLKWFRNGKESEYNGQRSAKDIVSWVSKRSGPPSKHLTSQAEVDAFLKTPGSKALGFLASEEVVDWSKNAADEKLEAFVFGHVTDTALFGSRPAGTIELHKDGEEKLTYDETLSVTNWLLQEGFPAVEELAQESWTRAMRSESDLLAAFLPAESGPEFDVVVAVAKANKGKFVATFSTNAEIGNRWGTSGRTLPTAVYVKVEDKKPKFIIWNEETETEFNAETLGKFVAAAKEGTYESYVKSEPIPESNDGPVTVLVAKNFDSIVRSDKNVLVEFYAPWCGHCQKLAPVYEELGASYKDDPEVVIAKIDATANSLPKDIDVRGYPTLILFDANNEVKPFEGGDRDFESIRAFIEGSRVSKGAAAAEKDKEDL